MRDTTIYLCEENNVINEFAQIEKSLTERQVFAEKLPIFASEFYEANKISIKPRYKFKIREIEYKDEELVKYKNKLYTITRTYVTNDEWVELTLSGIK